MSRGREERLGRASFGADGRRAAIDYGADVSVIDLANRTEVRRLPRARDLACGA